MTPSTKALIEAAREAANAPKLPDVHKWTGQEALEDLFDMGLRHKSGLQPYDYLKTWLSMLRPFAYATRDDSWGEMEKLLCIVMRNYVRMIAKAEALRSALHHEDEAQRREGEGDLKPCPFCGGAADLDHGGPHNPTDWTVGCIACDYSLEFRATQPEAIAAWNRRAPSPAYPSKEKIARVLDEALGCLRPYISDYGLTVTIEGVDEARAMILALFPAPTQQDNTP